MFEKLWAMLEAKGKFATAMGVLLAIPVNARAVWEYFTNVEMTEAKLYALVIVNMIGWVWVILPSKISVKGKAFEFTIED